MYIKMKHVEQQAYAQLHSTPVLLLSIRFIYRAKECVCVFVCFTPLFHWIFMFGNRSQYARKSSESYAQNNNFPIIILYVTEYAVFLALFSSRSVYLSHFSMKRFPLSRQFFSRLPSLIQFHFAQFYFAKNFVVPRQTILPIYHLVIYVVL